MDKAKFSYPGEFEKFPDSFRGRIVRGTRRTREAVTKHHDVLDNGLELLGLILEVCGFTGLSVLVEAIKIVLFVATNPRSRRIIVAACTAGRRLVRALAARTARRGKRLAVRARLTGHQAFRTMRQILRWVRMALRRVARRRPFDRS